jgi:hypothetical protein
MEAILTLLTQSLRSFFPALAQEHALRSQGLFLLFSWFDACAEPSRTAVPPSCLYSFSRNTHNSTSSPGTYQSRSGARRKPSDS